MTRWEVDRARALRRQAFWGICLSPISGVWFGFYSGHGMKLLGILGGLVIALGLGVAGCWALGYATLLANTGSAGNIAPSLQMARIARRAFAFIGVLAGLALVIKVSTDTGSEHNSGWGYAGLYFLVSMTSLAYASAAHRFLLRTSVTDREQGTAMLDQQAESRVKPAQLGSGLRIWVTWSGVLIVTLSVVFLAGSLSGVEDAPAFPLSLLQLGFGMAVLAAGLQLNRSDHRTF